MRFDVINAQSLVESRSLAILTRSYHFDVTIQSGVACLV